MDAIHLTIGAVAKRAGITVRTLHHYDHIGLVCPSARSESGYRLYSANDIERLHAVQSLKQLGLSLEAIAATLTGGEVTPQVLLRRQVEDATRKLVEIQELKEKLLFLEHAVSRQNASAGDLLDGIRLLETHQLYLPQRTYGGCLRAGVAPRPDGSQLPENCLHAEAALFRSMQRKRSCSHNGG